MSTLYNTDRTPRYVRLYCITEGRQGNRYTAVYRHPDRPQQVVARTMLAGPQDVYCEQAETIDIPRRGFWPGNRQIAFAELPEECQRIVRLDYRTLWYKERHREV